MMYDNVLYHVTYCIINSYYVNIVTESEESQIQAI